MRGRISYETEDIVNKRAYRQRLSLLHAQEFLDGERHAVHTFRELLFVIPVVACAAGLVAELVDDGALFKGRVA